MIVDTSALLAYFDANEPTHAAVAAVIDGGDEPLIVSPFVVAELDYLVLTRHGAAAEQAVLDELASGAWVIPDFGASRIAVAAGIVRHYADVPVGITDASLVVLADMFGTDRILTLDRRHFAILRLPDGRPIRVFP